MILEKLKEFLKLEASGGIILFVAGIFAMIIANTHYSNYYENFLNTPVVFSFGSFELAKPFYLWINDGLMAIFFFLIGLELKREFLAGELSEPSKVVLPVVAAIGGMLVPAAIYAYINWGNEEAIRGWAIPSATDIAFALGVLALLGSRVPVALKVFVVLTLALLSLVASVWVIPFIESIECMFKILQK